MATAFPKNFLWGAATSSHQVEGGTRNDWTAWEQLGQIKNGEQSGPAADQYHRFREDFALAKHLGHNAHRLSFEWSRIEPEPGRFDETAIHHYHAVIDELLKLGLEPMVTLHHFTNPTWVAAYGGWANRRAVDDFSGYAEHIAREFGRKVRYWITINEPTVLTTLGYLEGRWPPGRKNYWAGWRAIRHPAQAHRLAYQFLHRHNQDALVGVANNLVDFAAARRWHPLDQLMKVLAQRWYNDWWLNQTVGTQDFIGLNYYFHHLLRWRFTWPAHLFAPAPHPHLERTDLGWTMYAPGLGRILHWLKHYRKPIIITENGLADAADRLRRNFIRDHLQQVRQAIETGVDIRGYFHWSLIDNFEWAEGFGPRFGLVAVDYATQQRVPRPSAEYFRTIAETNGQALEA